MRRPGSFLTFQGIAAILFGTVGIVIAFVVPQDGRPGVVPLIVGVVLVLVGVVVIVYAQLVGKKSSE